MTILVCGSFAFDHIMNFQGRFHESILPEQLGSLSVSFPIDDKRDEFGGCAGNIAYNLRLLGLDALPLATVGGDFQKYAAHLKKMGIRSEHIMVLEDEHTSSAFIVTDTDGNQITIFHAGAMKRSHEINVPDGVAIGILAPEGREGMLLHARQMHDANIPFIFDPGQGVPMFEVEELAGFIRMADYLTCNTYEMEMIMKKTGWDKAKIASSLKALVVTNSEKGSLIEADNSCYKIPAAPAEESVDPTGCGDAYRAGLIYGIRHGLDWKTTGCIASLMGAYAVEFAGTQKHSFTSDDFDERFAQAFGYEMPKVNA